MLITSDPQTVYDAADAIIKRARKSDTVRAVFRVRSGDNQRTIVDFDAASKACTKMEKDFLDDMIGCYDSRCQPEWLRMDIERFAKAI